MTAGILGEQIAKTHVVGTGRVSSLGSLEEITVGEQDGFVGCFGIIALVFCLCKRAMQHPKGIT